jgi:hypothetical protein
LESGQLADYAAAGVLFIGLTIAVVVHEIADLGADLVVRHAFELSSVTRQSTCTAYAGLLRLTGCPRAHDVFVDISVTVIVESVADLDHRFIGSLALDPPIDAQEGALGACALIVRGARAATAWVVLVDDAVAVVVVAVTKLFLGFQSGHARIGPVSADRDA